MSDYSYPYTNEDAKRDAREEKLTKRLRGYPVSDLTVGELLVIIKAFEPWEPYFHFTLEEMDKIDKILG